MPIHSKLLAQHFSKGISSIVLYDGVCNFCNGWIRFLVFIDSKKRLSYCTMESNTGVSILEAIGRDPKDFSSFVLVELTADKDAPAVSAVVSTKSDAVIRMVAKLGPIFGFLGSIGKLMPLKARDAAYDLIARNRYKLFGKSDTCNLKSSRIPPKYADRFLS